LSLEKIISSIKERRQSLAVVGCGYVGLPTAALFADAGFDITAVDIKPEIIEAANCGVSMINESGLDEILLRNVNAGRFKALSNSPEIFSQVDGIIVSVQTLIDRNNDPDLSFLLKALDEIGANLKKGALVVVGSTVPPGTMLDLVKPNLENKSGLEAEVDFYLAYVPERIAPGKALKEFVESPRLIGGVGVKSTRIAAELFGTVCEKVIESDAATAEIAKLAENTFRDVNIAFANQLALISEESGVDVVEVIKQANTHPRVNIHTSGPGVGGPCLTKDPYLLVYKTKNQNPNIIETARNVNDYMAKHILKITSDTLANAGKEIKKSKVTVAGLAYKADVNDSRCTPSKPVIHQLKELGSEITIYDPYCKTAFGLEIADSLNQALENSDCLIIMTDHREFKNIKLADLKGVMNVEPVIIDCRRIIDPKEAYKKGFTYYGIGCGKTTK
jgi:UDP-N-acetyl-D-mannosaminuronic acid dehydrogenase